MRKKGRSWGYEKGAKCNWPKRSFIFPSLYAHTHTPFVDKWMSSARCLNGSLQRWERRGEEMRLEAKKGETMKYVNEVRRGEKRRVLRFQGAAGAVQRVNWLTRTPSLLPATPQSRKGCEVALVELAASTWPRDARRMPCFFIFFFLLFFSFRILFRAIHNHTGWGTLNRNCQISWRSFFSNWIEQKKNRWELLLYP